MKEKIEWELCPMGKLKNDIIECYYYGTVEIKDCNDCSYRKNIQ